MDRMQRKGEFKEGIKKEKENWDGKKRNRRVKTKELSEKITSPRIKVEQSPSHLNGSFNRHIISSWSLRIMGTFPIQYPIVFWSLPNKSGFLNFDNFIWMSLAYLQDETVRPTVSSNVFNRELATPKFTLSVGPLAKQVRRGKTLSDRTDVAYTLLAKLSSVL